MTTGTHLVSPNLSFYSGSLVVKEFQVSYHDMGIQGLSLGFGG